MTKIPTYEPFDGVDSDPPSMKWSDLKYVAPVPDNVRYQERTLRMPAAFFENELQCRALNMNRSRSLYFDKMFIV